MNVAAIPPVIGGGYPVPRLSTVPNPKAGRRVAMPVSYGGYPNANAASEVLRQITARMRTHYRKDTVGWMHDTINPLWNISSRQAQMIYDFARSGNYAQLEYLYNEIENCSPVFSVCVTRRTGALSELDWKVVRSDERLNRNADKGLVKEQIAFLENAIAHINNLPEALEHFALSAFRGFSVASVWRDLDGLPKHLECLDHWNICRDHRSGTWLWNPGAISFMNPTLGRCDLEEIPASESVSLMRKRQIDWPAMKIFLRESIGERDWGRFLETYGLPPVIITMPEFTSKEDQEAYVEAAADVFEGRSGVVPNGSEVNFASESRGVNPFTEFVDHQTKLFVLLSTGGTLTSLSEATGIGSGASETQMDTWKQIVRADVRMVSNAINRQLCQRLISEQRDFKDKPILAEFKLDTEPRMSAKEVVEMASSLSSAGYEMDAAEISQIVGFTVRKKAEGGMGFNAEPPPPEPNGGSSLADPGVVTQVRPTGEAVHKADAPVPANASAEAAKTPSAASVAVDGTTTPPNEETPQNAATPPLARELEAEGIGEPPKETRPSPSLEAAEKADAVTPQAEKIGERLVRSLQRDFKGVADELARVLAMPEAERAGAAAELLGKVDALVPDDPAMAEVIAEQMQEAFDLQMKKQPEGDAPAANKAIPN